MVYLDVEHGWRDGCGVTIEVYGQEQWGPLVMMAKSFLLFPSVGLEAEIGRARPKNSTVS